MLENPRILQDNAGKISAKFSINLIMLEDTR